MVDGCYATLSDEIASYEAQMIQPRYGQVLAEPRRRRPWWRRMLARMLG